MKRLIAAATISIVGLAAHAETYELRMSASHSTDVPWVGQLSTLVVAKTNDRLEALGSEDRVEWIETYGGSLYGYKHTLEAVTDGITDAGWVGTLWEGSKMPLQNVTFFTPFVTDDLVSMLQIMNEMHREMPELQAAWDDQNAVLLGASGVETYHLFTNFPVNSLADIKGRRILAPGASALWINHLGAVPVNGALPTYQNQVRSGLADGMVVIVTGAFPHRLYEEAPYVTLVGLGAMMTGGFAINKDVWESLSDDVRFVLAELGEEYTVAHAEEVISRYEKSLEQLSELGAIVSELPSEEVDHWAQTMPNLAGDWLEDNSHVGARAVLSAYMEKVRSAELTPRIDWAERNFE